MKAQPEKVDEIKQQLEIHKKRAEEKLKKRMAGDGFGDLDDGKDKKSKDKMDDEEREKLKKRDIKAWRKEMKRLKKEVKQKARQEKLDRGELVEPQKLDPAVKLERNRVKIEKLKSKKVEAQQTKGDPSTLKELLNQIGNREPESDEEDPNSAKQEMMAKFVNNHIVKCVDDCKTGPVTSSNIALSLCSKMPIADTTVNILKIVNDEIQRLQTMDEAGSKKYDVPAILVMTVDTMNVVEMNKELVKVYGNASIKTGKYDVRVHKLFARHIKPQEQADQLAKTHPMYKTRLALNVYLGTPNRLAKLMQMKAFKMDRGNVLKLIVIDCRLNKKEMSVFEDKESKKDAMEVLVAAKDRWNSFAKVDEKRLKLCLV